MVIDTEPRPLLTIVVPVYAVEGYLYQCLESIRAGLTDAEADDVEVIAVDDASPDDCGEMLDSYAHRRGGVRVIHLPRNVGLGPARNAGLEQARGTYVWFVDSDDWLPKGSVRAVLDRLRATRPDVLLVDHLRVLENGRTEPDASSHLLRRSAAPSSLAQRPELLRLQHTAWNKVIRRTFLDEIDLRFRPGWYEDIPFSHPVLLAARRIDVLDRVCYHYRVGRLGAITSTRSIRHFEAFDQYERLYDWLRSHPVDARLRAEVFTLMVSHYLVVAGNDGRVHPRQRRAFFRRAAEHYRRYRPEDCRLPDGPAGLKHRLVRINNYELYAALRTAYRVSGRRATPTTADPVWSSPVRPDLAAEPQSAQGGPLR